MNFLKQNLLLVGIVLVVLVVGGVLVSVYSGSIEEGQGYISEKQRVYSKLSDMERPPLVNDIVVKDAEKRVKEMEDQRKKVIEWFLARNRAGRQVLTFQNPEAPGKVIKAFPIESDVYNRHSLRFQFPDIYHAQVEAIRKSLSPTVPPTVEEIAVEQAIIAERAVPAAGAAAGIPDYRPGMPYRPSAPGVGYRPSAPGRGYRPSAPGRGYRPSAPGRGYRPSAPGVGYRPSAPGMSIPAGPDGQPGEATGPPEPTPAEIAHRRLVVKQAAAGQVYADQSSMHLAVVRSSTPTFTNDQLWMAQLSLWVQQDIAAAIIETNKSYRKMRGTKPDDKGVPFSAVKRLMSTNLRGYVLARGAGGGQMGGVGKGSAVEGSAVEGLAVAGASGDETDLNYLDSTGAAMMGRRGGGIGGGGGVPKLTGRHGNPIYDVVHYEFTVIVASTELTKLYKNLMIQNHHTILDVGITAVGKTAQQRVMGGVASRRGPRGMAATAAAADAYYYGTDPVVQARITGEMLLATDWTRGRELAADVSDGSLGKAAGAVGAAGTAGTAGTAGAAKITWDPNYPPLMPVSVLTRMHRADSEALREVDVRRVQAAGGSVTDAFPDLAGKREF